jgi:hypothetical protein
MCKEAAGKHDEKRLQPAKASLQHLKVEEMEEVMLLFL